MFIPGKKRKQKSLSAMIRGNDYFEIYDYESTCILLKQQIQGVLEVIIQKELGLSYLTLLILFFSQV